MNKDSENPYLKPMQPYPGLEHWSRQEQLPGNGFSLHFYDTGGNEKTPILLLHGLGDEADTWRHVLPQISENYRAIAPDLPGFGRSEKPDRKYTVPFFVDTLLELLDLLQIRRAVLAGHSTGAIIAHEMAFEHPERVERLILIGGSLVSRRQPLNATLLAFMVPGLGEWLYTRLRKDPEAAYRTLEPYYNRLDDLPAPDRDFLFRRVNERVWSDGQRKGYFATLRGLAGWLPAQQKDLGERLKNWKIPTQILWGENDQVNPVENGHALVEMMPAAKLTVVPSAGHNVQQERAGAVVETIYHELL